MKTLPVLVAVGTIAVLFVSGVLTVQFHPDKLANLGTWATEQISQHSLTEEIRAQALIAKRKGEAQLFKEKKQSMDIALKNAKDDVRHLEEVSDVASDIKNVTPALRLTIQSLEDVTQKTQDITVEQLASLKSDIANVFLDADVAIQVLKSKGMAVDDIAERLKEATTTIEVAIGSLKGQVAGVKDETEKAATPTPNPTIPIRF